MEGEYELYNVEKIIDRRFSPKRKKTFYLIKWEGYTEDDNSWEPEENLETVTHILARFNAKWDKREQKRAKAKKDKLDRMAAAKRRRESMKAENAVKAHLASRDAYSHLETSDQGDEATGPSPDVTSTKAGFTPSSTRSNPTESCEKAGGHEPDAQDPEAMLVATNPPHRINFTHMLLQPSLTFDQPTKILGCRKTNEGLSYLVMFRRRADGQIPCAAFVRHTELAPVAPGLLSQFLLYHLIL